MSKKKALRDICRSKLMVLKINFESQLFSWTVKSMYPLDLV